MAISLIQSSFSAGEISTNLFARVDLDKYHSGAAVMRNFFVDYRGGASSRAGTELIDRTKNSVRGRLIPFIFSQTQSYVLELGNFYMRFYSNGAALLQAPTTISGISRANPCQVIDIAHGYSTLDTIVISGVVGMTEVNGQTYNIVVVNANVYYLTDLDGVPINSIAYHAYVSGGVAQRVYEITTPWSYLDLPKLKFVQSADVMTFTHNLYPVQNLSRTGPSAFALTPNVIGAGIAAPTGVTAATTVAGNFSHGYLVVAVTKSGERSLPSSSSIVDSKALDPLNATAPVVNSVSWSAVAGADHYEVFKWGPVYNIEPHPTFFGYIGSTTALSFPDTNIAPDFSNGPPEFRNPFASANYPGCVSYYQQRRVFGNLVQGPEELDFSKTGAYNNFDTSFAVLDSDAIQIALASRQVNEIKSMVPTSSGLVVLTSGGAFQISGGAPTAAITPSNIVALPQASSGANDMPPIVVNYDILFVQNKGSIVRDLAYNFYLQTFYGFDRSTLSSHLFFGHRLTEWAWAEEPFKIVWAVRSDGRLLSLTYVPEQEIYGWAQHDTQGIFESVCVVPEGDEDRVYFIVQRQEANGTVVRYVERMASRHFFAVEDSWCVDCAVSTQLTSPGFGLFVSANATTAFLQADTGFPFDSSWIGKIIWLSHEIGGGKIRVTTLVSPNQIDGDILQPLGDFYPGTSPPQFYQIQGGLWGYGPEVTTVSGLGHLAGLDVACVADGESVGPLMVSAAGVITLPQPASKVIAGLDYLGQLQTLDLDVGEPTVQGKRKKVAALTLRLDQSRGLSVGDSFETLTPIKELPAAGYTPPLPLFSGDRRKVINGRWSETGRLCIQLDQPFPATVLGVIPEVTFGDTQT